MALEALRRRAATFAPQRGAEPARIGLPLNAGGDVRAVLALALDFAPAGAALDQARRAVALAGVLGALLGTLVLALWTAGRPSRAAPLEDEEEEEAAAPSAPEPPVEADQPPLAVWDAEPATSEDLGPDDLDDALVAAEAFPHDDPLTGLLTEHGFVEELREELVRAQVDGYRVTVCALEIDRTHGFHPVRGGSAHIDALRLVATRLTSELDAGELCARRGERFLLALGRMGGTARGRPPRAPPGRGGRPRLRARRPRAHHERGDGLVPVRRHGAGRAPRPRWRGSRELAGHRRGPQHRLGRGRGAPPDRSRPEV